VEPAHDLPETCHEAPGYPDGNRLLAVHFELGSADLTQADRLTLRRLAKALRAMPSLRVSVSGFTDDLGPDSLNLPLSTKRAQGVADALIAGGVPKARLDVQGFGSESPLCAGATDDERAAKRRTEITVVR
jgi:outer membrane protein OmpA-like peptidoglycan-associated protein